jgi:hypothetical protein
MDLAQENPVTHKRAVLTGLGTSADLGNAADERKGASAFR